MKLLDRLALIITIIGAVSWLLIGIFDFNLITTIFGEGTVADVVYIIIGVCGLWSTKYFSYTPNLSYKKRRQ